MIAVYIIKTKTHPDRTYIGSTTSFKRRRYAHLAELKRGVHHTSKLQNHVSKYGIEDIYFEILEELPINTVKTLIVEREQYHIDLHNPFFNSLKTASNNLEQIKKGRNYNKDRNDKISKKLKGRLFSEEWRANISKAKKGISTATSETKQKLSKIHTGRKVSNETREKLRINATGNQNMLGKKHSEATKELMSKSQAANSHMRGKKHSEETKQKMITSRTGKKRGKYQKRIL